MINYMDRNTHPKRSEFIWVIVGNGVNQVKANATPI